jgi:hypothetical protein
MLTFKNVIEATVICGGGRGGGLRGERGKPDKVLMFVEHSCKPFTAQYYFSSYLFKCNGFICMSFSIV